METEGYNDVLPVMDLQGGRVVHAVRGEREHYQSVCRLGLRSDRPSEVANWYAETYGFRDFYVADLDAIQSGQPQRAILRSLMTAGRTLYVDAGWSVESMAAWDFNASAPGKVVPVIATESLQQLPILEDLFRVAPSEAVLSVDLLAGKLCSPQLQSMDPAMFVLKAYEAGFRLFLILDLKDVGDHRGPSALALVPPLRRRCPDALFWGGGGVRGLADLDRMRENGFCRTLVATAFYRGLIPPRQRRDEA